MMGDLRKHIMPEKEDMRREETRPMKREDE